jgi:hypothetical protein
VGERSVPREATIRCDRCGERARIEFSHAVLSEERSAGLTKPASPSPGENTIPKGSAVDARDVMPLDYFAAWFAHEVPPGTIISDPKWWAPRIYRAIVRAAIAATRKEG